MKRAFGLITGAMFLAGLVLLGAAPAPAGDGERSSTVRVFTDDFSVTVGDPGHWNRFPRERRHVRNPERHGPFRSDHDDHRWRRGRGLWIDAWFGPPRYERWSGHYGEYGWPDRTYRYRESDRPRWYQTRIWVAGSMTENGYVPGYWKVVPLGRGGGEE